MIKKFFFYFFILIFGFNTSFASEQIAFIDLNYIFLKSNAGKKLNLQIKEQKNSLDTEIKNFKKDIDEKKNLISAQKNVLSQSEYEKKILDLEKNVEEINLKISQKNKDLSIFKLKAEKKFFKKLNIIVEEYSISNSINLILKKENLLMGKKNLDITEDIFKIFNENIEEITIN
tara:strand:+ start:889 stop:1410 length:522 start_codon:yes stop_codon:yes gene_type:complete